MKDIFDQVSPEDAALLRQDLMLFGTCYVKEGKRVSPLQVASQPKAAGYIVPENGGEARG